VSLLHRVLGVAEERAAPARPLTVDQVADIITGGEGGKTVSDATALRSSAVYAAVRLISEAIAALPVDAYEAPAARVRRELSPRPSWLDRPNDSDEWLDIASGIAVSLLLRGNAYLSTTRAPSGRVEAVHVLDPDRVVPSVVRLESALSVVRFGVDGSQPSFTDRDVLHIPGMRRPGQLLGISPITAAASTVRISQAAETHHEALLGNYAAPGVLVEVPGTLSDQGLRQMRATWKDMHHGPRAGGVGILTEGAKAHPLTLSPVDAQVLETRRFSVEDIARTFGVAPHLLGQTEKSTSWGSGLQEQSASFVRYALTPWLARIEKRLTRLVRSEPGRPASAFVRFTLDGLLRGDSTHRAAVYAQALAGGWLTLDEVRALEDLPPLPGGGSPGPRVG
jgi:HK97 family phage portal protein